MRCTKAIIHIDYLKQNISNIKALLKPETKMCIAVKANAYGHGIVECAKAAVECGTSFLAIAAVEEGIQLRQEGITVPLLLLSLCSPEEIPEAVDNDITPLVFDEDYIDSFDKAASSAGKKDYAVHITVDTGMGRVGCRPEEALSLAKKINSTKSLKLGGIQTHFAASDGTSQKAVEYTEKQFNRFMTAVNSIKDAGIDPGICHCANSAAAISLPKTQLDMVRPGIIVYGYYPDEITREFLKSKGIDLELKPVMTLETSVCSIKKFLPGESVSYGMTWTSEKETNIAILPVGYGDGFFRHYAKDGVTVTINGKNYPIRGRICMDQCMVDIGNDSGIKRWDKAVIFGSREDGALQTADDIASLTKTISYEITTAIESRVPRLYVY